MTPAETQATGIRCGSGKRALSQTRPGRSTSTAPTAPSAPSYRNPAAALPMLPLFVSVTADTAYRVPSTVSAPPALRSDSAAFVFSTRDAPTPPCLHSHVMRVFVQSTSPDPMCTPVLFVADAQAPSQASPPPLSLKE